jgi:hypothetical protein
LQNTVHPQSPQTLAELSQSDTTMVNALHGIIVRTILRPEDMMYVYIPNYDHLRNHLYSHVA